MKSARGFLCLFVFLIPNDPGFFGFCWWLLFSRTFDGLFQLVPVLYSSVQNWTAEAFFFCVHVHIDKFLCDVSLFSNVKTEPGQKRIQDHLSRAFLACCCDQASSYYISSQSWLGFHQHGFRTLFLVFCLQLTALALRDRCSCNE